MTFLLVTIWWFSYCFDILSWYILCLILLGICVWRGRPAALRCYISWCCKGFWGSPGELCLFAVHFFIMIIMLILMFCQMFLVFWVCCTNLTVFLDILVFLMKKFQTTQTFLTDFLVWSEELKDVCYVLTNCILLG